MPNGNTSKFIHAGTFQITPHTFLSNVLPFRLHFNADEAIDENNDYSKKINLHIPYTGFAYLLITVPSVPGEGYEMLDQML